MTKIGKTEHLLTRDSWHSHLLRQVVMWCIDNTLNVIMLCKIKDQIFHSYFASIQILDHSHSPLLVQIHTLGWLTAVCIWSLLFEMKMAPAKVTPTMRGSSRLVSATVRLGHQARPSEDNWMNLSSTGLTSALMRKFGENVILILITNSLLPHWRVPQYCHVSNCDRIKDPKGNLQIMSTLWIFH